jgi:hypothetical protein
MKILFASGNMQGGGAQRFVSILANELVARDFNVSILVVRGDSDYELDPRVRLLPLYEEAAFKLSVSNKIARRLAYFPRLIGCLRAERPDAIIPVHGGGWNGKFVLFAKLLAIRVIVSEQISHTARGMSLIVTFLRSSPYAYV